MNGADVAVTIEPPAGSSLHAIATTVFAPSKNSAATIESGVMVEPSGQTSSVNRVTLQSSIYHCYNFERGVDVRKFGIIREVDGRVNDVREMAVTFNTQALHAWYAARVTPCGASEPNVRVRELTWRWGPGERGLVVVWTIWLDIVKMNTQDAITVDGVIAEPHTTFFAETRNVELVCPYYFRPPSQPPPQQAGCI
jgi:hypothetical protein